MVKQLADLDTLGAKRGAAGHISPFSPNAPVLEERTYPSDARGWVEGACDAIHALKRFLDREVATRSLTEMFHI
jgi:hypothetical protein